MIIFASQFPPATAYFSALFYSKGLQYIICWIHFLPSWALFPSPPLLSAAALGKVINNLHLAESKGQFPCSLCSLPSAARDTLSRSFLKSPSAGSSESHCPSPSFRGHFSGSLAWSCVFPPLRHESLQGSVASPPFYIAFLRWGSHPTHRSTDLLWANDLNSGPSIGL